MKQVIVMRKDLNMRKGKMAAQAAHASMTSAFGHVSPDMSDATLPHDIMAMVMRPAFLRWLAEGMTKVVVGVDSERHLMEVAARATDAGLPVFFVTDAGRTEFGGVPTLTCAAIGPGEDEHVDTITGELRLL